MPNNESLLHQIRSRIDYEELFAEFLPSMRGRGTNRMALCIFHANTDSPALSVNVEEGLYQCMNPECNAHGDFVTFYMRVRSITRFGEAVEELARRCNIPVETTPRRREDHDTLVEQNDRLLAGYQPPATATAAVESSIDDAIIESTHQRLLNAGPEMTWLAEQRGITRETVERFRLGHDGQRYYIPICEGERCLNIRRYKPNARQAAMKMISWRPGFGAARLWPMTTLTESTPDDGPVFLLEGEMDTLLAIQHGLRAITSTGGAGTWKPEWNTLFARRHVVICYDNDQAGRAGAHRVARELSTVAASVKVLTWPHDDPPGFDFTDFMHGYSQTVDDFVALVSATSVWRPPPDALTPTAPNVGELPEYTLAEAGRPERHNKEGLVPVRVSGIASAPTLAPKETQMFCGSHTGSYPMCEGCPMRPSGQGGTNGAMDLTVRYEGNDLLDFMNARDTDVLRVLKGKAGIPSKCPVVSERRRKSIGILPMQGIPDVGQSDQISGSDEYVTRMMYQEVNEDDKFMKANLSYRATILTVNDPKTQSLAHIVRAAVPSQSDIDVFQMSNDAIERLGAFRPERSDDVSALWEKMDAIHSDLERVTRIYERRDLLLAVDLTYMSSIGFIFQGDRVVRGWMECLIIGDTRTGKTTIVQRLLDYYRAGEFSSGENTSFAGLVGGLNELQRNWFTRWGKVPLNDRRLLVIDEAGNLPHEQIARMSSMRSSGIAEIVKIHTERTHARTRQIWISNPRGNRPLSTYSQGTLAVKELIGAPEDIARFDLVVTAGSGDVTLGVINAARGHQDPQTFTSDLCHQRVMWAWSRRPEQVVFDDLATAKVLELATLQGDKYRYATEIPLVEPNEQRVKLARLAAAVAAMFFCTRDGQTIDVSAVHVQFAYEYLEKLYSKPSLAFDEYARQNRRRYDLHIDEALELILHRNPQAMRVLMEQETMTQGDLMEIFGYDDRSAMRDALTRLREAGFIRRVGSSYYVKTPGAITWLRAQLLNGNGSYRPTRRPATEDAMLEAHRQQLTGAPDADDPPW
jgi:hypothetical protein